MGEEKLFQLTRVNVLAAANDHVLVTPGDAHITLVIHARQITGVHPACLIDGLRGAFGIVPVTQHHAVAARAQLTDGAARNQVAGVIDDLAFQLRLSAADGGHTQFQFV
ncbi:hypothetical protein D3C87_1817510 [compost metagenome]